MYFKDLSFIACLRIYMSSISKGNTCNSTLCCDPLAIVQLTKSAKDKRLIIQLIYSKWVFFVVFVFIFKRNLQEEEWVKEESCC